MRTLTFGVLIVAGGTLAALPFRRQSSNPVAVPNTNATGPIGPTMGREEMLIEDIPEVGLPSLAITPKNEWPRKIEATRQIEMPLTYEDLAVPVETQIRDTEQFNATEPVQKSRRAKEDKFVSAAPRMKPANVINENEATLSTPSSQPQSILISAQTPAALPTDAKPPHSDAPPLPPKKAMNDPVRKWIRQP